MKIIRAYIKIKITGHIMKITISTKIEQCCSDKSKTILDAVLFKFCML